MIAEPPYILLTKPLNTKFNSTLQLENSVEQTTVWKILNFIDFWIKTALQAWLEVSHFIYKNTENQTAEGEEAWWRNKLFFYSNWTAAKGSWLHVSGRGLITAKSTSALQASSELWPSPLCALFHQACVRDDRSLDSETIYFLRRAAAPFLLL